MPRRFTSLPPAGAAALGAWYDADAAQAAVDFFRRFLRLTEGEWAGQPFVLSKWQEDRIVRPLFGWKRADGSRLFREFYVEVPRKNGKTELGAGLALLLTVGDAEMGAQGYCAAVNKDQAEILFKKAARMVGYAPPALANLLEAYKTSIYCAGLNAGLHSLSANPRGKQGFNPSFAIADETHEWASGELAEAIQEGMGARRQPMMGYITTAGVYGEGYGWELHERARKVVDGELEDPTLLVCMYGLEEGEDWRDPAVWARANPGYGVSVKPEFLAAQAAKAAESPRQELRFRRYFLNDWTESDHRWLDMTVWDENGGKESLDWRDRLPQHLLGRACYGGLDLSATTDTTSRALIFPPETDLEPWYILWKFFLPAGRTADDLEKRAARDRVPYPKWRDLGALTVTEGDVVDYDAVYAQILEDARLYDLKAVAFDRWNSQGLVARLQEEGVPMLAFGQGYASMSGPTKEMERLLLARSVDHGGNPMARSQASNTAVLTDPAGNMKPAKDKSTGRIDGTVAAIMALGAATAEGEEAPQIPSGYRVAVA